MVKALLKDYPKVASPVEVRIVDEEQNQHSLWGADEKNLVLMGPEMGFPPPLHTVAEGGEDRDHPLGVT